MEPAATDLRALRPLGRSGIMVTPVGLGCWQFSKGHGLPGKYWSTLEDAEIGEIVAAALAGGINWFDTAEGYGGGESERALARSLRDLGLPPGQIVIATKWSPILRRASSITGTIDVRLTNLAPFPIDLHQIHNPWSFSPVESQVEAMARLVEDGKVRSVGVSNFSRRQMERSHRALERFGLPLASNQVRYSLLDRRIETDGVLDAAKDLGITVIAYSPLAQGIISGRFHDDPGLVRRSPGFRKYLPAFKRRALAKSLPVVEVLRRVAPKYGATPVEVALNWLIWKAGATVVAIPGATRAAQVTDFTAAMSFRLSGEDREELDKVSAPFKAR